MLEVILFIDWFIFGRQKSLSAIIHNSEMFDTADFFIDRLGSHFGAYCKAFNSFADLFHSEMSSCTICYILKNDPSGVLAN